MRTEQRVEEPTQLGNVVIVGGGSAGCVIAGRLSADPRRRVVLLEAGPDYGHYARGAWPPDILDAHADAMTSHSWGFPGGVAATRGRILGGCSSINGCGIVQGLAADYDAWSIADPAWSFETLQPYLRRARETIRTRLSREDDLEPWRQAFLIAAANSGVPQHSPFDEPMTAEGVGLVALNAVGSTRWNAAFAYVDPARARANLDIRSEVLVDRIAFEAGRVRGVSVIAAGSRITIPAAAVVLCAGTYASPAVLVRSGLGPHSDLTRLGIPVVRVLDGVGAGLRDHALVDVPFRARPALRERARAHLRSGRPAAQVLLKTSTPGTPWSLQLGPWHATSETCPTEPSDFCGIGVTITQPESIGRVIVRSADPAVLPVIEHNFLGDDDDRDAHTLLVGVGLARTLAAMDPIAGLADLESSHRQLVSSPDLLDWIRGCVQGNFHPIGTCRMGSRSDTMAVVDGTGAVHGINGLWLADASVFPRLPRANTHLTVLAVAERIAEHLDRVLRP
jgi:choline dehydrogenase